MSPRTGFVLALLFSLAGCAGAVSSTRPRPPLTPEERLARQVDELAAEAAALVKAQDEVIWRSWTEGAPLDLSPLTARRQALYTREALDRIDAVRRRTSDADRARALDLLRAHFAGEYLALATASQQDAFAAAEGTLTFSADGQEYPLRDLERLLARERNALKRQALHQAAAEVVQSLHSAADPLDRAMAVARTEAGYRSALELAAALRRTRPEGLAATAETILASTDEAFRKVLEGLAARELRLPFDRVRARDLPRMFRSRDVDALFPAAEVAERAFDTARGLGIDPRTVLKIDDRALPEKTPQALALAVSVPADVRLSYGPLGGVRAQERLLHELGHALHAAHTRQPSFALGRLGGGAVDQAFSALFAGLIEDPNWLKDEAGLEGERLARYRAESAAWELYRLRRNAGHLLFAIARLTGAAGDPQAQYAEIMSRALGVPFDPADRAFARVELDSTLASASALEAAVLAHQLRAGLEKRFGARWWQRTEAGEHLRTLWAHGTALDAQELAKAAGEDGLSPDAALAWFREALGTACCQAATGGRSWAARARRWARRDW